MIEIRRAGSGDLEAVVTLFEAYREFYRQPPAPEAARRFLSDRLGSGDSVIFLAFTSTEPVGFTQLYPGFSSVRMARIFVLNDLFVVPGARRSGVAWALLRTATEHARGEGAVRMALSTAITNTGAQTLYEKAGWQRDTVFHHYQLELL